MRHDEKAISPDRRIALIDTNWDSGSSSYVNIIWKDTIEFLSHLAAP